MRCSGDPVCLEFQASFIFNIITITACCMPLESRGSLFILLFTLFVNKQPPRGRFMHVRICSPFRFYVVLRSMGCSAYDDFLAGFTDLVNIILALPKLIFSCSFFM